MSHTIFWKRTTLFKYDVLATGVVLLEHIPIVLRAGPHCVRATMQLRTKKHLHCLSFRITEYAKFGTSDCALHRHVRYPELVRNAVAKAMSASARQVTNILRSSPSNNVSLESPWWYLGSCTEILIVRNDRLSVFRLRLV